MFPYVNSLDYVNKFGVSTHVYRETTCFSCDDMYQWNRTSSDPVRLVSNSFKIRDNRQNTCIHMNTHENTYWWSGTNYEPVWHVPTGLEMVPCLLTKYCKRYYRMAIWDEGKLLWMLTTSTTVSLIFHQNSGIYEHNLVVWLIEALVSLRRTWFCDCYLVNQGLLGVRPL